MLMRENYEAPELNLISFLPQEKLASSIGFNDMSVSAGISNEQAPIESTDISVDFW